MKKIDGFDKVQEQSTFRRLKPDAYVCKILGVEDVADREYLRVSYDIAEGESKGYFTDKKWAQAGTLIRSYKQSALSMFKGFITAVEKSNKGYVWDWDEKSLKGKTVVLIIGEEEYLNQRGEKRVRNYVSGVRSVEAYRAGDYAIPALKELDASKTVAVNKQPEPFVDPFANETPVVAKEETVREPNTNPFEDDLNPFA